MAALAAAGDRGAAVATMARGATQIVARLHDEGRLDAIVGLGGTGGSSLVAEAMRGLPVGVPKLLVSTVASGDTRPYVGAVDVTMMYSVVDIAGVNTISARIIANAAAAIAGMAQADGARPCESKPSDRSVDVRRHDALRHRGARMARGARLRGARLPPDRYRRASRWRSWSKAGFIVGVLDVTTTELCDELVGGVFARRSAAARGRPVRLGIPQVVSLGALDMVNFGPRGHRAASASQAGRYTSTTRRSRSCARRRTSAGELGHRLAEKLNRATGPTALYMPLRGISMIATEGQPFHDPAADEALVGALRESLPESVETHELDLDINDPTFAVAMAERLDAMIKEAGR